MTSSNHLERTSKGEISTHDQRHLKQTAQLLLLNPRRARVNKSTLVAQSTVRPDEDIVRDRLPEDLDLEDVGDDLLRLTVNVRVDERDVVVACNDVSEGRETLLDALDSYGRREGVPEVLEFLVGRRVGDEESVPVALGRRGQKQSGHDRGEGMRVRRSDDLPAQSRPMMRVPPIVVLTMGMTSWSSLSK
jgi:hypothetical protein